MRSLLLVALLCARVESAREPEIVDVDVIELCHVHSVKWDFDEQKFCYVCTVKHTASYWNFWSWQQEPRGKTEGYHVRDWCHARRGHPFWRDGRFCLSVTTSKRTYLIRAAAFVERCMPYDTEQDDQRFVGHYERHRIFTGPK